MTVIGITIRDREMQWLDRAACRDHNPELFFPMSAVGPGRAQAEDAKRVCRTCPVLAECLEWAIASAIPFGVLGGLSEEERKTLMSRRGTPRRTPVRNSRVAHRAAPTTTRGKNHHSSLRGHQ